MRFKNWVPPVIEERVLTQVQLVKYRTKIISTWDMQRTLETFTYINAQFGVTLEDFVQIGSHCSIYSVSTIDDKRGPGPVEEKLKNRYPFDGHA